MLAALFISSGYFVPINSLIGSFTASAQIW
jgi:hypothetical protein